MSWQEGPSKEALVTIRKVEESQAKHAKTYSSSSPSNKQELHEALLRVPDRAACDHPCCHFLRHSNPSVSQSFCCQRCAAAFSTSPSAPGSHGKKCEAHVARSSPATLTKTVVEINGELVVKEEEPTRAEEL